VKSASTEGQFDPMVAKANSGVREIFVRLRQRWRYMRWVWTWCRVQAAWTVGGMKSSQS
jgi:hypothetical protein